MDNEENQFINELVGQSKEILRYRFAILVAMALGWGFALSALIVFGHELFLLHPTYQVGGALALSGCGAFVIADVLQSCLNRKYGAS